MFSALLDFRFFFHASSLLIRFSSFLFLSRFSRSTFFLPSLKISVGQIGCTQGLLESRTRSSFIRSPAHIGLSLRKLSPPCTHLILASDSDPYCISTKGRESFALMPHLRTIPTILLCGTPSNCSYLSGWRRCQTLASPVFPFQSTCQV